MYNETIDYFSSLATKKLSFLKSTPIAFFVGAMMAGAYVGLGIILIFSVANQVDPSIQKLVMGLAFGIALSLVVFAGAELFTGHTMYMVFGWLSKTTGFKDLVYMWSVVWLFNLIGAVGLSYLYFVGGGPLVAGDNALLLKVASYKMNSPVAELVARAVLCNWLVCLALWVSARTKNDAAKCILIFWCLFGFIASGYEHSVANMTVFSLALLSEHSDKLSLVGMFYNLFWVSLGNIFGGAVFMALGYWTASGKFELLADSKTIDAQKVNTRVRRLENSIHQ